MNLRILGGPSSPKRNPNPRYRGTDRWSPYHFDSLSEDHPHNEMFFWYLEEGGETGVVHNLTNAFALAKASNESQQEEVFEVVEVTVGTERPETNGEFLGFDLAQGFSNSLLEWGLESPTSRNIDPHIGVLCDLHHEFFRLRLNQYGLFNEFETASFCLQSMIALQSFHDCLFEGGSLEVFRIVGVYLVSEPASGTRERKP